VGTFSSSRGLAALSFPEAPRVLTPPPGPKSRDLLARQAARESNARSYPRRLPIALAEARGATVRDVDGNTYIDCLAGAGSLNAGHNNPDVVAAVQQALAEDHVATTLDLPTHLKDEFTSEILSLMPRELREHGRIQFCGPAGTFAVDAAIKLAKIATGRTGVVSFRGAYHGMGQGPLSLMGATSPKQGLGPLLADVHFMPYGYCLRCPLKLSPDMCRTACASLFDTALGDPFSGMVKPAAVIVEPIQGEGGVVVPPDGWLARIAASARDHDVPLICDEIQTGLGRTGRWFAFEHEDVVPDAVVLSKSIGGLGLPIAVVVYHERLDRWQPGAHAGTFRGNQLAMAAGIAGIRFMREANLVDHAAAVGQRLMEGLRRLAADNPAIREVRGRGLMVRAEMATPDAARAIQAGCLACGVIVELGGRGNTVVRFLPPLVLTADQADAVVAVFAASLADASSESLDIALSSVRA
jgi:diaminobutyrate-2-oxoglutarate transaminase